MRLCPSSCIQHFDVTHTPVTQNSAETIIAEIIAVGSEMLTPFRQDTNSLFLTAELNTLGVSVAFKTIVGDSLSQLTDAIRIALRRAGLVLISGGLGPTEDDLTREALAAALDLPLLRSDALLDSLRRRFAARNIPMPPNNSKQADILDTAEILPNPNGSAVGQYVTATVDGQPRIAILLPGPPRELKPLFTAEALPRLRAALPAAHLARRVLRMAVIPESLVDSKAAPIYTAYPDVETTILAGSGEIQLHFACAKPTAAEAEARVDSLASRIRDLMGDDIFSASGSPSDTPSSSQGQSLPETVLALLDARHLTLATAESCTGGLLAERLTAVPGASRTILGGTVAYTPASKSALLDIPADLLAQEGAVSPAVARLMAENIRTRTGADLAIAITGIAGPSPALDPAADAAKPIGLVHLAIAGAAGTTTHELLLSGDRDLIRLFATQHALDLLRRRLLQPA